MSESIYEGDDLDSITCTIGDWAQEKGWQGRQVTEEDLRIARLIASRMNGISALCVEIEHIRKHGESPFSACVEFLGSDLQALKCSKIGLVVTELAEMYGAITGCIMEDDKIPAFDGESAELADTFIRLFQYASEFEIEVEPVLIAKHEFNITRPDRHGKLA